MEQIIQAVLAHALTALVSLGLSLPSPAKAQRTITPEFTAKVIHVADGDTVTAMRDNGEKVKVRLANIDAPESHGGQCRPGQPYAGKSKDAMKKLVLGKQVEFTCSTLDRYDRSVCDLHIDGTTANRELVRQGLAWANRSNPSFLRDRVVAAVERDAKDARLGLWSDPQSVAPWQWRREMWSGSC